MANQVMESVQPIVESIAKLAKKPTFEEAYWKVLEESHLRAIAEGRMDPSEWHHALNHDLAEGDKFIKNFCEDINSILKRRRCEVTMGGGLQIDITTLIAESDWKKRAQRFWERFQHIFGQRVHYVTEHMMPNMGTVFPLSKIVIKNKTCVFDWADNEETVSTRTLVDIGFIHPEDFPKNIPSDVRETLVLLKDTHYDYSPKIMDGVLIAESKIVIRPQIDPALVLNLGHFGLLMVDYWKEPWTPKSRQWWNPVAGGWLFGMIFSALFLVGFAMWFPDLIRDDKGDIAKGVWNLSVILLRAGTSITWIPAIVGLCTWYGRERKITV